MITIADETMIIPAIPDIINEFTITYSDSFEYLSHLIAGAVMTPIASKIVYHFGKKKFF